MDIEQIELDYNKSIKYIESTLKFGSKPGIERVERILKELGNPEEKLKVIHIAGTNGKGSTSAMISNILVRKGFKTGLFISPHLEDFRERIQINNKYISKEAIIYHTKKVKDIIKTELKEGFEQPTEFEIVTCIMLDYFAKEKVDYAVIEVGLGGLMDSTNVVNPLISVITHISYDHEKVLGSTLTEIAENKAGIIKSAPVIMYPQEEEAEKVILEKSKKNMVEVNRIDLINESNFIFDEKSNMQITNFMYKNQKFESKLNLLGKHQILNAKLVLKTIEVLSRIENIDFEIDDLKKSLESVIWMGRFEKINKKPLIILDGAHNIDGIERLKETLNLYYKYRDYHLILGILSDKQVDRMVDLLATDAKNVYCITPNSDRAELSSDLNERVKKVNANSRYYLSYENALHDAIDNCFDDEMIIIAGSLYMIGDMRKIIKEMSINEQ